jgi:DNA-binding beta-propeller fold protein YncE
MPPQVFADGGAPNVAYVAGTMEGITTIDISQQKVTSTIPLPGDPHTTLLSIDGKVLYATQPNLGDISGGMFGPMDYDASIGEVYVPDTQHDLLDVLTPITSSLASSHKQPGRVIHLNGSPGFLLRRLTLS